MAKTIDFLRQTVDLYHLAAKDTNLKRTGSNWYAGPCPFCGGKDRFVLKRTGDGWRWLCRHCTDGKYLDAVDYIQRRENLDFKEAVRRLGGEVSSPLRDDDLPPLAQKPKPVELPLQDPQTVERLTKTAYIASKELDGDSFLAVMVRNYLDRRGILLPTQMRGLLGAKTVFDPNIQRKRPAVAIPYFDTKLKVRAIKYRFVDENPNGLRYVMESGSINDFYYLPEALGYFERLVIVEGELNLLSLAQLSPKLDLISTGGHSLSENMKRVLSSLAVRYRQIYCWFDEPQKAVEVAMLTGGIPIKSPQGDGLKWDANKLLCCGLLPEFLDRVIHKV